MEDGVDVYIDELRHLPDNVSLVKIVVKILDEDAHNIIPEQTHWAEIDKSTT